MAKKEHKKGHHKTGAILKHSHRGGKGHKQPSSVHSTHHAHNKMHGTEGGFCAGDCDLHGPHTSKGGMPSNETHE